MPASKIQDETEVRRWFEEGRSYQYMIDTYLEKYNIETSMSMWSNFRARHGLGRRHQRNDDLIPWSVDRKHRWRYPLAMLRYEARRRAGMDIAADKLAELETWKAGLQVDGLVIHYEPDTEEGFFYVERREGIDTDLIREPERKTTRRRSADRD